MTLKEMTRLMYLIKLADQKISAEFEKKVGFSLTRYELLLALVELEPCLQTQLQMRLKIDQAAITRQLKILEAKGYIARQRNEKNQREVIVTLTKKAKQEMTACEQQHEHLRETMYPFFTESELGQLTTLLTKLNDNL